MKRVLLFVFIIALFSSTSVYAQPFPTNTGSGDQPTNTGGTELPVNRGGISLENPIKAGNITELFTTLIDVLLIFAVPLIVFFIIYAGFLYVTARGNEATIQKAHMALLYALIGGVIILGAKVLIEVISGTVNTFGN